MYQWYKDNTIPLRRAEEYPEKIPIGEFRNIEKKEWTELWDSMLRKVSP
jgi:hypothetical protein